jgi:hypothetical protein
MTSPRERRRHRARHESTLYLNVLNVLRYARLRGLTIFRRPCLTGPEGAVRHLAETNSSPQSTFQRIPAPLSKPYAAAASKPFETARFGLI